MVDVVLDVDLPVTLENCPTAAFRAASAAAHCFEMLGFAFWAEVVAVVRFEFRGGAMLDIFAALRIHAVCKMATCLQDT